jgi:hypothetical protein
MSRRKARNNPPKFNYKLLGMIILLVAIAGGSMYAIGLGMGWWASPFAVDEPTVTLSTSSFSGESAIDGEDVSGFTEMSLWIPEDEDDMDEFDDYFVIANFEEEVKSKDMDDVSIDISDYLYVWVEIDPDAQGLFATEWILLSGVNADYQFMLKDQSTDVNFNMLDRDTLDEITVASYATDGNYSILFDCPHYTTTANQLHANTDDWDMDDEKWDELDADDKLEYYDESNWAGQYPIYIMTDDDEKDYDEPLEQLTDALAFKMIFNTTVSTTDGSATQVNCTIPDSNENIEVIVDGVNIWFVYYEAVTFEGGANSFTFDLEFGADIEISDVDSGRVEVPRSDDNLGAFTKYSDIGA